MATIKNPYPAHVEQRLLTLLERPQELRVDSIDRRAIANSPLSPAVHDVLGYFVTVEGLTPTYETILRANPGAAQDPIVDRFLGKWRREELTHSEVLATVLELAPVDERSDLRPSARPLRVHRGDANDAVGRGDRLMSMACRLPIVGDRFAGALLGLHMAWGGLQESLTNWGYSALRKGTDHPELKRIITAIKADEHKHQSFYYAQAEWRLSQSAGARALSRFALRKFYEPVGVSQRGRAEFGMVVERLTELSGKALAAAESLNDRLSSLPGLAEVRPMMPALERTRAAYRAA